MGRHHTKNFEFRLKQEIGYGPLIIDLIADICGQDDWNSRSLSGDSGVAEQ
jgi:hypothetical protein